MKKTTMRMRRKTRRKNLRKQIKRMRKRESKWRARGKTTRRRQDATPTERATNRRDDEVLRLMTLDITDLRPGVKADVGALGHEGVVVETVVEGGVFDDHRLLLADGVATERDVAWGLGDIQADLRLEPLPVAVDQTHQRDRDVADLGGERGEVVKRGVFERIQNMVCVKRREAFAFLGVLRGGDHTWLR